MLVPSGPCKECGQPAWYYVDGQLFCGLHRTEAYELCYSINLRHQHQHRYKEPKRRVIYDLPVYNM